MMTHLIAVEEEQIKEMVAEIERLKKAVRAWKYVAKYHRKVERDFAILYRESAGLASRLEMLMVGVRMRLSALANWSDGKSIESVRHAAKKAVLYIEHFQNVQP